MKLVPDAIKVGDPLPCGLSPAISRHEQGLPNQQDPSFMLRNFQECVKEEQCFFDLFQVCYHPDGSEWLRKELCHTQALSEVTHAEVMNSEATTDPKQPQKPCAVMWNRICQQEAHKSTIQTLFPAPGVLQYLIWPSGMRTSCPSNHPIKYVLDIYLQVYACHLRSSQLMWIQATTQVPN